MVTSLASLASIVLPQRSVFLHNGGVLEREYMAILNIKNFPEALYKKLRARAKRQHRSISQEVTHLLSDALEPPKSLSILGLRGLGKEHWRGVDPSEHVARERNSWD